MGFLKRMRLRQPIISAACSSHIGKKRSNNEDNFFFLGQMMPPGKNGTGAIVSVADLHVQNSYFAVMDGMGGYEYGELASSTAAETAKVFFDNPRNLNPCDITPSLCNLCTQMNDHVLKLGKNLGVNRIGTTLVSLFFHCNQVWMCNIGDSRAFLLRDGKLNQLSKDHNDMELLRQCGLYGRKPHLTQYIGLDPDELTLRPYVKSLYPQKMDRYLLCSDGLTDMVPLDQLSFLMALRESPESCVSLLVDEALKCGGNDNITVIVIDVTSV